MWYVVGTLGSISLPLMALDDFDVFRDGIGGEDPFNVGQN